MRQGSSPSPAPVPPLTHLLGGPRRPLTRSHRYALPRTPSVPWPWTVIGSGLYVKGHGAWRDEGSSPGRLWREFTLTRVAGAPACPRVTVLGGSRAGECVSCPLPHPLLEELPSSPVEPTYMLSPWRVHGVAIPRRASVRTRPDPCALHPRPAFLLSASRHLPSEDHQLLLWV